jgi:hypothetical protein
MPEVDPEKTLWVESTRDPDGDPIGLLRWGPLECFATAADLTATAMDMLDCAAYAEVMMQLVEIGLPVGHVAAFVGDLLKARGKPTFGMDSTVHLVPAGSSKRKLPLVLISRVQLPAGRETENGPLRGSLDPAAARQMARQWLEVAGGIATDQLIMRALPMSWSPSGDLDVEKLFTTMRDMRGPV